MGWCILELIVLLFDVVVLVFHFVTGNVSEITYVLLGVTISFGAIVISKLFLDIRERLNSL